MNTPLDRRESDALREIRSALRLMGKFPSVRELMTSMGYRSPRSAAVLLERLESKGFLDRTPSGQLVLSENLDEKLCSTDTIDVPIVGQASCGLPGFAEQNVEGYVRVSTKLAPRDRSHFLLRAEGDSMNEAGIQPGDLVLVRTQDSAADGDRVVALIDDEATIKIFRHHGDIVALTPRSSNPEHQPIIVTDDLRVQGVVVTAIPTL